MKTALPLAAYALAVSWPRWTGRSPTAISARQAFAVAVSS